MTEETGFTEYCEALLGAIEKTFQMLVKAPRRPLEEILEKHLVSLLDAQAGYLGIERAAEEEEENLEEGAEEEESDEDISEPEEEPKRKKQKRNFTPEQREAFAQRMRDRWAKKKAAAAEASVEYGVPDEPEESDEQSDIEESGVKAPYEEL